MRIIAGQRRGHKIDGPKAIASMRPTSDLVRESLFNIVGPMMANRLVIDLFAGTGAVGLEALSRGAGRAIFIEKNRESVALIRRNIATLRYLDRAQVKLADAYRWVRSFHPGEDSSLAVFLDPPYREYELHRLRISELIGSLVEKLPTGTVIALEAGRDLDGSILPDLEAWDIRRYGDTQLAIRVLCGSVGEAVSRASESACEVKEAAREDGLDV